MERFLQMMIRMLLGRGVRQLLRPQGRRRSPRAGETPSGAAERETAERMRQTQTLSRRIRR